MMEGEVPIPACRNTVSVGQLVCPWINVFTALTVIKACSCDAPGLLPKCALSVAAVAEAIRPTNSAAAETPSTSPRR